MNHLLTSCWLLVVGGSPNQQPIANNHPPLRVGVLGEGRLRFAAGRALSLQASTTLVRSAAGLVADAAGRPVLPQVRVSGPFAVAMNGTVSIAGRTVGRLVLQRPDGELGFPGEGTFGVLQVTGGKGQGTGTSASSPLSPVPSPPALIEVRARTEVDGDRVLLRDIADVDGSPRLGRIDLGATPALGSRRTLTKWGIQAILRDAGFAGGSYQLILPPDATVARKGQTVDAKTIVDAATEKARETFGDADLSMGQGPAPIIAPTGAMILDVTASREADKMAVTVRVRVDGRSVGERTLNFRAQIVGVKTGEAVRVVVARNGAVLETDGRAKTGGGVGDAIQIVTPEGTVLTATVLGSGRVEVKL